MEDWKLQELTEWATSPNTNYKIKAAEDVNLPVELQEILMDNAEKMVRYRLCSNPNLNSKLWATLANDEDWQVRSNLAFQKHVTDIELHKKLANDEEVYVRYSLARNSSLSREIYEILLNDSDSVVRDKAEFALKEIIKAEFKEKINE